jgi:CheY-like chemotaxis protein
MSRGRILVVDDEIYIVHILDFSLGMEGYEVVTALDGEEALEKAMDSKPDLIVLDIMMPKMDGYETCKALKADDRLWTASTRCSAMPTPPTSPSSPADFLFRRLTPPVVGGVFLIRGGHRRPCRCLTPPGPGCYS